MKPHINFLIRCGIVIMLIIIIIMISNSTDPAETSPDHTEPSRIAPEEPSERTESKAYTDMPCAENEPHAATERTLEPNMNLPK